MVATVSLTWVVNVKAYFCWVHWVHMYLPLKDGQSLLTHPECWWLCVLIIVINSEPKYKYVPASIITLPLVPYHLFHKLMQSGYYICLLPSLNRPHKRIFSVVSAFPNCFINTQCGCFFDPLVRRAEWGSIGLEIMFKVFEKKVHHD